MNQVSPARILEAPDWDGTWGNAMISRRSERGEGKPVRYVPTSRALQSLGIQAGDRASSERAG
jgi:hypothetical protein